MNKNLAFQRRVERVEWMSRKNVPLFRESPETPDERSFLFAYAQSARERQMGSAQKHMHMIFLHIERASGPGVGFTDTADFLFDKHSKLAHQNLFPLGGTADTRDSPMCR
jgi:hypothetical protein